MSLEMVSPGTWTTDRWILFRTDPRDDFSIMSLTELRAAKAAYADGSPFPTVIVDGCVLDESDCDQLIAALTEDVTP